MKPSNAVIIWGINYSWLNLAYKKKHTDKKAHLKCAFLKQTLLISLLALLRLERLRLARPLQVQLQLEQRLLGEFHLEYALLQ